MPVLDDHKKQGKLFVAPMRQLKNMELVSYLNDTFPELIWFGLIIEHFDYREAFEILEIISHALERIETKPDGPFMAHCSYFALINEQGRQTIIDDLKQAGKLHEAQIALAPIICLYYDSPLSFFGTPSEEIPHSVLVDRIRHAVETYINNRNQDGVILCSASLYAQAAVGKLHIAQGIDLPDFNVIFDGLDSDEAKHAASFIRAQLMAFQNFAPKTDWAESFWNQNFRITPCEN